MKKTLLFLTLFIAMLTFGVRAQIPVFTESFEGTSIPAGWTTIDADQDGYGWEHSSVQGDVPGYTGSGAVASYSYDNATYNALTPDNWLITPAISLSGTSSLSFWFVVATSYPGDHYGVYVSTTSATDTSTFTLLYEMTPTSANGAWTQQTVDLTSYAGNSVYIAFRHFNCTDMLLIALDDITVSTMTSDPAIVATPNALNFGIVDVGTSVVQTVDVAAYNNTTPISVTVTAPFAVSADSITFGTSATLPAAGGTLYVKFTPTAGESSSAVVTLTAGSLNATISVSGTGLDCTPLTLPYTETFEPTSLNLGCWTLTGDASWGIGTGDYSSTTGAFEGSYNAVITHTSTGNVSKLISPSISGATNGLVLHFAYVMRSWAGDIDELRVYSRSAAGDAWQQVAAFTDATTGWTVTSVAIPGNVYQVAFEMTDSYGYGVGLDSVVFTAMSSTYCAPVIGLTASNITSSGATLSWVGDANNYTVINMSNGSVLATQNDTAYTITGLLPMTQYTYGVVANCTSESSDTVLVTFTTACGAVTLPFTETFDASLANNECWRGASALVSDVLGGTALTQGSITGWSYQSSENNGIAAGHYRVNIYGTTCKYWLITPEIDLGSVTSPLLTFDVAFTKYSGTALADGDMSDDKFWLLISTDGGQTWDSSNVITYNLPSLSSLTYLTQYVDLTNYVGDTIKIAFYGESTVSGGDNNLHLDNISITESTGSICLPVNSLMANDITKNSATLNWAGTADSYNVYVLSGNDTTLVQNVTNPTIDITGLTPETDYTYGVCAVCGSDMSPMVTVSFTTLISCSVPTNLAVALTPGNGTIATLTWTEVGTATAWQICVNEDTTNIIDVTNPTYDFTNLTPEQAYTVKVRANCDVNDMSAWSAPFTFTPTNAYVITVHDGSASNSVVPVYGLWVDDITKSQFIIPASDLTAMQYGTINKLTFYSSTSDVNWGVAEFSVYMTETTETTLSSLADYSSMSQVYAGTLSINNNIMEVTLTNPYLYMGGNLMIGFLQTVSGTYSSSYWIGESVNDVSMGGYGTGITQQNFLPKTTFAYTPGSAPTCMPVTGLTASNVTSTQATLSWTGNAASYSIYEGNNFVTNVSTTSYTVSGLTPATSYVFGVVAVCSATDSSIVTNVSFNTECGTITTYPYVQDFAQAPSCWMTLDADGDGQTWILYQGTIQSASYNSVALTPDNWLISPQFAIPAAGNYEVTWTATAQDQSWPAEHYGIFVSTTDYSDTANFTMLQEWTLGPGLFNPVVDLSNYAGQNIYIALRHFNCTDQFRLSIDDFIVREQAGANQVTINAGPNNPAYGTVAGAGIYTIGDNVTLTATANSGYTFAKWVDENNTILSTNNPYTFVAATDLNLTAIFLNDAGTTYVITVQVNDSTMGTAVGGGTYTAGDQITLTATPFTGYNFVNWTQVSGFGTNVVGTEPNLIITVTSDKTFVANFEVGSGPVVTNPTVATGAATAVGISSATLNATITNPDDVTITAKGFEWKTTAGGTYTQIAGTGTGNTFTADLTGLADNTSYTYKAFITYNGTTVYGEEMTFTTEIDSTGIEDYFAACVKLYPNPAKDVVNVQCTMDNVQGVEVFDAFGKLITTVNDIDNPTRINVSGLADGMYFVRVTTEKGVVTKSFVKR